MMVCDCVLCFTQDTQIKFFQCLTMDVCVCVCVCVRARARARALSGHVEKIFI